MTTSGSSDAFPQLSSTGWTVVVPVKRLNLAKSRLEDSQRELDDTYDIQQLAFAFASDVIEAALRAELVQQVIVVTDDQQAAEFATEHGAYVILESEFPSGTIRGLNGAVSLAQSQIVSRQSTTASRSQIRIAIVAGDLPCLTPAGLDQILDQAGAFTHSFVPDESGQGTTMLLGNSCAEFPIEPRFGLQSARLHTEGGSIRIPIAQEKSRLDVDTHEDLMRAQDLGVGIHTGAILSGIENGNLPSSHHKL